MLTEFETNLIIDNYLELFLYQSEVSALPAGCMNLSEVSALPAGFPIAESFVRTISVFPGWISLNKHDNILKRCMVTKVVTYFTRDTLLVLVLVWAFPLTVLPLRSPNRYIYPGRVREISFSHYIVSILWAIEPMSFKENSVTQCSTGD